MTSAQNNNAKVKKIRGTDLIIDFRGEPLGSGSFGKVRRAYDLKNQSKKLCCKIFQINDESKLISAKNEFKIVAQLPYNPNLVSFEKIKFITRQEMYLFMEYCNGGDLQGYIKNNDYLSEYEIKDFLYQFIEGYTDLFKLNILHRDLKPENILIHNKKYKIADFGLSKLLEFEAQEVEAFGNILTQAPEIYPLKYRDLSYKDTKDYSKIDMFSLGVILYNMAYKYESHPYVGLTYQLFYQKQQKNQSQIFCLSVNNAKQIVFPDEPRRSQEFKDLIKRLCDKNVQDRMSFVELIESDYPYSHLKNKNSNQSALFQSEFKQLSILQFNNRESIFPQPSVSVSQIMKNLDHGQSKVLNQDESQQGLESQLQNIPSILEDNEGEEEDITQSGKEVLHEQSEMELNLQLELMEEEMRRLDKQNSLIFAIFDKCIYLRELVFFYDKVQLHIDNLIHMISKRYPLLKHLDQILARLRLLRIACIYESSERNTSIYRSLLNYYTQNEVNIFLQSKEFQNFEKLRCQDESQLASNKESILNTSFLQLERNQALNCLHDFSDVYESIEEKGDQKLSLVAYWYIYQVYLLLKNTSTFDNIEYERNSNKFIQYYEVIDHHLTIEDLFDKVKEACDFLNIPVIVNL